MPDLKRLVARLKRHYGEPSVPPARGPFELVIWENACYLLSDERRATVFKGLREQVGLTPAAILKAPREALLSLAGMGGMRPETRVFRWREIARIAATEFEGNLNSILDQPYDKAKKALKQFPSIGDPGAEKILVFCGAGQGLPLESNGLRVLSRAGFGRVLKSYAATYRSVQEAVRDQLPRDNAGLVRTHLWLRQHGKTFCRANAPLCRSCPISELCEFSKRPARG